MNMLTRTTSEQLAAAMIRLNWFLSWIRLPGQPRWVPPGYVPMRHAWLVVLRHIGPWGISRLDQRDPVKAVAGAVAASLADGTIRVVGLEWMPTLGRNRRSDGDGPPPLNRRPLYWWAPRSTWQGAARIVMSVKPARFAALQSRFVLFQMPDGSQRWFIPFISMHHLAVAMGAADPPPLDRSGDDLIHDLQFWPRGFVGPVVRPAHRPTSREEFIKETLRRVGDGIVSGTMREEAAYLDEWQKAPFQVAACVRQVKRRRIMEYLRSRFNEEGWPTRK